MGSSPFSTVLGQSNIEQLKQELERYAKTTPIALVLPSLYAELERPALKRIVEILAKFAILTKSSSPWIKPPRWSSDWPSNFFPSSPNESADLERRLSDPSTVEHPRLT